MKQLVYIENEKEPIVVKVLYNYLSTGVKIYEGTYYDEDYKGELKGNKVIIDKENIIIKGCKYKLQYVETILYD